MTSLVPSSQLGLQIAKRARIRAEKSYHDAAIGLSEHFLFLYKKGSFGKQFSLLDQIHFLTIDTISITDKDRFSIEAGGKSYSFHVLEADRVIRYLLRNYIPMATFFPVNSRFSFSTYDPSLFPSLAPAFSPSQMFQFIYAANCSLYQTYYIHDVVRYIHQNFITGNAILNLNELPIGSIDVTIGDPIDLRPIFLSLMFCPFFTGVTIENISTPQILISVSQMLAYNQSINMITVSNCQCVSGGEELKKAVEVNRAIKVGYWDLSYNRIKDIYHFMTCLRRYPSPIWYLDLTGCGLDKACIETLFYAIKHNSNLGKIKYLHISGSEITSDNVSDFVSFLTKRSEANKLQLVSFDGGDLGSGAEPILEAISTINPALVSLKIAHTCLKKKSFQYLIKFCRNAPCIETLDISYTKLKNTQVHEILEALSLNPNTREMSIGLNGLQLHGQQLRRMLITLQERGPMKWTDLQFEDNGFVEDDYTNTFQQFSHIVTMKGFSFGESSLKLPEGFARSLSNLAQNSVTHLKIRPCDGRGYGSSLYPFLESLANNTNLKSLDISYNGIGDQGLEILARVLIRNRTLNEINFEGSHPKNVDSLLSLFSTIQKSDTLTSVHFPIDDISNLLAPLSGKPRTSVLTAISQKWLRCQTRIRLTQASFGFHSDLSMKGIPDLDVFIDNSIVLMHKMLAPYKLRIHNAYNELLGFPYPFQTASENEPYPPHKIIPDSDEIADKYESANLVQEVEDPFAAASRDFETLQFSSLCIRRPGAATALQRHSYEEEGPLSSKEFL